MDGADHLLSRLAARLHPVCTLEPEARLALVRGARVERLPAGARLNAEQEAGWLTYLVKGELLNRSPGGTLEHLAGGSPRSLLPVFQVTARGLHAVTRNRCFILRFDRRQFRRLVDHRQPARALHWVAHSEALRAGIQRQSERAAPALPPLPAGRRRLITLASQRAAIETLAAALGPEQELAARLLAFAFRGQAEPGATLTDALNRLGPTLGRCLILGMALQPLFSCDAPTLEFQMQSLHRHSLRVGAAACLLARRCGHPPELALLAGLVHDLGAVAAVRQLAPSPRLTRNRHDLERAIRHLRPSLGPLVLRELGLGGAVIAAAEDAEHWYRDTGAALELADLLVLAHLFTALASPHRQALPPLERVPAFRKLGWSARETAPILELVRRARKLETALGGDKAPEKHSEL